MAVTYGGQGKNEFAYGTNPDGTNKTRWFSIVYNKDTNVSQVYVKTGKNLLGVEQFDPVGTINFNTGKRTLIPSTNLSSYEKQQFQSNSTFKNLTESTIKEAAPSANAAQLLQPRGTLPAPTKPGGGNPDAAGGNAEDTASPSDSMAALRNVSSFQSEEDKYGNWIYPIKMNLNQDYLIISTYNYQVADVFGGSDGISNIDSGLIFGGANPSQRTLKNVLGSVTLPMPSNISEANQTGWGEDSLNNLAAGLMGGAVGAVDKIGGGDLVGGAANLVDTAKTLFNSSGAKAQIKQQLTLNAAASVVKKLGVNINAEGYRARVTGTVINPNLELLFNGPKLRAFQFSFKMAPRSADEAKHIRGIIKFFKKSMAPKRAKSGGTGDEFFLGAPNIFRIKFMNGKKESNTLPTLKTCALVNFTVNYTADGFYSAFNDGQPISVQIDLSFAELTPIYNDNYGSEDSVGFPGGSGGVDNLENPLFDVSDQQNKSDTDQKVSPPGPPRGGTSGAVAPVVPTTGGRNPTSIPGDPGYKPPSPGGGLLEGV
jgi:hypothetical protein